MKFHAVPIASVAVALLVPSGLAVAAPVSTPYLNTFDTAASTNDFVHGASPANKLAYVEWAWAASAHQNYMRSANAQATLFGWATLDVTDLGGTPTQARNFDVSATMRAKSNVGTTLTKPGGFQGLCALASNEGLGDYYYGMVYFTNVVGYVSITKVVAGSEVLSATYPTTITFDRDRHYRLRLSGEYSPSAAPNLTLTLQLSYGSETNALSLVDPDPLTGRRFGYRSCNNNGGCWVWWDNLSIGSSEVRFPGTVVTVR